MLKRSKFLIAAVAAMIAGTGSAGAALTSDAATNFYQPIAAYKTIMYSDATKTVQVGEITGTCQFGPGVGYFVQYYLTGQYTDYQEEVFHFYCPE